MFLHSCPAKLLFICGKQTFINHYSLYVFFFWVRKHKIKKYTYNSRQTDAAHGEIAISKDSTANTNGQRYRNNDGVSGVVQVHFVLYKVLYAHRSNIMPPSTAAGMLCSKALSFPITEKTMAVAAEMRITCG